MKKKGQEPTGVISTVAKQHGFASVAEMLKPKNNTL